MINNATPDAWRSTWLPRIYRAYAVGVGVCLAGAFAESFANLVAYFRHNGLAWPLAVVAPSMIDVFTIGGEVLVLIATIERWPRRFKVAGWCATGAGLAVSVAGNVGKDGWTVPGTGRFIPPEHAVSYAIAPLALAGLLALGLMIVKQELKTAEEAAELAIVLADAQARIAAAENDRDTAVRQARAQADELVRAAENDRDAAAAERRPARGRRRS